MAGAIERNNVHVSGTGGDAMMFAHGFSCDQNMWRFVAPTFEKDFRTILFDHVGAGEAASVRRRSRSCCSSWTRTIWAGRRRWRP